MRKVLCTIHEGQISKPQIHDLEAMIKRVYRDQINSEQRLLVVWTEMPEGQGFTEAHGGWTSIARTWSRG